MPERIKRYLTSAARGRALAFERLALTPFLDLPLRGHTQRPRPIQQSATRNGDVGLKVRSPDLCERKRRKRRQAQALAGRKAQAGDDADHEDGVHEWGPHCSPGAFHRSTTMVSKSEPIVRPARRRPLDWFG